jgi:hypothetical protein
MTPAALGFRAHSGWAVFVVLGGSARSVELLERGRVEMVEGETPRQPYHAAENLSFKQAEKLIADCISGATRLAQKQLADVLQRAESREHTVIGAGVLSCSGRPLPDLAAILGSHALIHTAEGEMFRNVLSGACEKQNLPVIRVKERELNATAAAQLGISADDIQSRLSEMGRRIGPPWRQDEKMAALIAWLALATASKSAKRDARGASSG